ncbi:hypothetical protein B0H16DRAFT_1745873 [Mycena metata]|uniref:CxC2-like cysteine cluster KDZ transposase-associated domain-containing protein n=1 Tax=Mycena metata TaxID=1033252 RepID=A0AAD7H0J0_9AGAR|nr:hypothetical protein B0H16DRAFT_1745873 [Mycena metata]
MGPVWLVGLHLGLEAPLYASHWRRSKTTRKVPFRLCEAMRRNNVGMPGAMRKRRSKKIIEEDSNDEYNFSLPLEDFLTSTSAPTTLPTAVERTSADGRRTYTETLRVEPPSPFKRARLDPVANGMDCDPPLPTLPIFNVFDAELEGECYDMDLGGIYDRPATPLTRKKARSKLSTSDKVMNEWRTLRDEYLQLLLRLEGPGDGDLVPCPSCKTATATIRCKQCFGVGLYCRECTVQMHANNPLHIIDEWNGDMFHRTSLQALGLRIQMHHDDCVAPVSVDNFVVLDIGHRQTQVLQKRWYPATHDTPRTAATFNYLNHFLLLTHQAKTTTYDLTRGSGGKVPNRYPELLCMVRQWQHLKLLMWAGRGLDPVGVNGTKLGGLVIECPACPRPDVNLPDDWEEVPESNKFLYSLFLALDACFQLKRRLVSSELHDPGLGTGWAYFVEQEPYRQYLLTRTNEQEMSTCRGLAALDYANTNFSRGYSVTGVAMGVCARHEFVQPTGVGDLQKGERYSNTDWVFSAIMRRKDPHLRKVISYDIVCQWFLKLFERLLKMPATVRFFIVTTLFCFVIPKMHIHSHTLVCQLIFSLNLLLGAGQTDGEGIERPWANFGGVATSTCEMGPGSRRDTLDSHLSYWNWSKLISIGAFNAIVAMALLMAFLPCFFQRICCAVGWIRQKQKKSSRLRPSMHLPRNKGSAMVHAFEGDAKAPNPYQSTAKAMTEGEVRLKLAEEKAARGQISLHDVSPTAFIYTGLELEEQQCAMHTRQHRAEKGPDDRTEDRCRGDAEEAHTRDPRFRKLQATYSPGALQALVRRPADPEETPERTPLMLPSALTAEERKNGCMAGVEYTEAIARNGQCGAALLRLRHQLHIKSRFIVYKRHNSRHQGANTRSRTLVARNKSKICLHSEKYQTAWAAIRALNGGDASTVGWQKLCQADIRMMEDAEDAKKRNARRKKEDARRRAKERWLINEGEVIEQEAEEEGWEDDRDDGGMGASTTENRRLVSWIWTVAGNTGSDVEIEEVLRIKWAKAYARSRRWKEEIRLLEEEYRWILVSFEHEARRWEVRVCAIPVGAVEEGYAQGATVYGLKQAAMYREIAARAVVLMTEVRHGRGRKRTAAVPEEEEGAVANGALEEREEGEQGAQRANEGDAGDNPSGDESGEDKELFGANSDEEFFMGGEDEDD